MAQLIHTAAKTIEKVIDNGTSLDKALSAAINDFDGSVPALKEMAFGGCRYALYYESILSKLLKKPLKPRDRFVHFLLIVAMYQLDYMSTPDHAVVNEAVGVLGKSKQVWAKKLVNGVLRSYLRSKSTLVESVDTEYEKLSFPKHLYDSIKADWPDNYLEILRVSNQKPPLTLRVNQQSSSREEYLEALSSEEIGFEVTKDSVIGFSLNKPVDVGSIPGFSQGSVSVQDESAQLTAFALDLEKGLRVLDGCAAPGGKTCLLLETQPDIAELVAIDFPHRIQGVYENLERMGLSAKVVESDMSKLDHWWDQIPFDRILLDVPCSGTGVIRRHPDIRHRRRQEDIKKFHDQQIKLLNTAWQLLKPGGIILYVTCSVLKYENDGVIGKFLENLDNYQLQSLPTVFGLETEFGRQRLPGVHSGDGFYYCKLQKQS